MDSFIYFILSDKGLYDFVSYDDFYSFVYNFLPNDSVFYNTDLGIFWYFENKLVAFSLKWCII